MNELDIALERLHLCAFETDDARPNCGPMVALALELLGHAALTSGFIDVYVPRFPAIEDGTPLPAEHEWRTSSGGRVRATDGLATLEAMLATGEWQPVVSEAVAGAFDAVPMNSISSEGLLRLCFAVAGIERLDNPTRRRELAFGLAYAMAKPPDEVQDDVEQSSRGGTGSGDLAELDSLISDFCLEGAERYLATRGARDRVAAAMNVVVPSAARFLLPHLSPRTRAPLFTTLISQCGDVDLEKGISPPFDAEEDSEVERCAESVTEIRYRAACSVHEHAILMAGACLREDEIRPNPVYRLAAADAALRLSPPGYQEWR